MKITGATIITGRGSDKIVLHTDLLLATYPFRGTQSLSFEAAQGTGDDYMRLHLPDILYDKVKLDQSTPKFGKS